VAPANAGALNNKQAPASTHNQATNPPNGSERPPRRACVATSAAAEGLAASPWPEEREREREMRQHQAGASSNSAPLADRHTRHVSPSRNHANHAPSQNEIRSLSQPSTLQAQKGRPQNGRPNQDPMCQTPSVPIKHRPAQKTRCSKAHSWTCCQPLGGRVSAEGGRLPASVRRAEPREALQERAWREGLGAEHAGAAPGALVEQLERDDGVDRGLPDDRL
jgi:hypothetical protein